VAIVSVPKFLMPSLHVSQVVVHSSVHFSLHTLQLLSGQFIQEVSSELACVPYAQPYFKQIPSADALYPDSHVLQFPSFRVAPSLQVRQKVVVPL
jgi:hypothetical protein